nr:ADP-ribosyltransferase domain-containing protein [Jiangella mangrovi]
MAHTLATTAETLTLALDSTIDELGTLLQPERAGPASPDPHPDQVQPLTAAQIRALHFYTTVEGVEEINRHLRRPQQTPAERRDDLQRLVDDAVAGLAALPRFDGVSFRGTTLPAADLPRWRPGAVVADRGFASSSASAPVAEAFRRGGNAFLTIAGRTGADIRSLSFFAHEAEVLFAPGTRFRVVGRSWDHRRECWSFQLEEVVPCVSTATPTTA